jgi:hypothetical protein
VRGVEAKWRKYLVTPTVKRRLLSIENLYMEESNQEKRTNHFYLDIQNRFLLFSELNKSLTTDYKQVQHWGLVQWFPITDCRLPLLDSLSLKYH